jgi:hypothetical protein
MMGAVQAHLILNRAAGAPRFTAIQADDRQDDFQTGEELLPNRHDRFRHATARRVGRGAIVERDATRQAYFLDQARFEIFGMAPREVIIAGRDRDGGFQESAFKRALLIRSATEMPKPIKTQVTLALSRSGRARM